MIVVAIVPAFERADSVGATVDALARVAAIGRVIVVDDGSNDATSTVAAAAGASVVRLDVNVGKGGAVAAGLAASPEADVVVLIDADTGHTATSIETVLDPVLSGDLDMAIAVLPSAGGRGGFGLVRGTAHAALRRATGLDLRAPLSGQRAIRRSCLADVDLAPRFGLEVGLTLDLHRAGCRIGELDAPFDHRHTGRSLAGFRHRYGQGRDLLRALVPRIGVRSTCAAVMSSMWRVAVTMVRR